MATRNFSSVAVQATLTEAVTSVGTSWKVTDVTGWPSPPFVVIADKDKAAEEAALVTAVSGTTITVTRGWDSTPALPHEAGATVTHGVTAVDFRDANLHVNATVGVHGVTGAVVGTTDTQVLDNKTFTSSSGTSAPLSVQQAPGQSGNLVELRTAAGQVAGYFDAAGKMVAPAISVTQRADFTPASSAAKASSREEVRAARTRSIAR